MIAMAKQANFKEITVFKDRTQAGKMLASIIKEFVTNNSVVLALPKGGLLVAAEVAKELSLPLNFLLVKKIGFPPSEELALGAIGEKGVVHTNLKLFRDTSFSLKEFDLIKQRKELQLHDDIKRFRKLMPFPQLAGKDVILVDDGLATGATLAAAIQQLKDLKAKSIVVAVPVAPPESIWAVMQEFNVKVVALKTPVDFVSISQYFKDFHQVSEEEFELTLKKLD